MFIYTDTHRDMSFKIHQSIFQVYVIFICKALPILILFSVFTVYSTHTSFVFTLVIWLPFITIQTGHQAENALIQLDLVYWFKPVKGQNLNTKSHTKITNQKIRFSPSTFPARRTMKEERGMGGQGPTLGQHGEEARNKAAEQSC